MQLELCMLSEGLLKTCCAIASDQMSWETHEHLARPCWEKGHDKLKKRRALGPSYLFNHFTIDKSLFLISRVLRLLCGFTRLTYVLEAFLASTPDKPLFWLFSYRVYNVFFDVDSLRHISACIITWCGMWEVRLNNICHFFSLRSHVDY